MPSLHLDQFESEGLRESDAVAAGGFAQMPAKRYWGPVVTTEFGMGGLAEKHRNPLPNVDVIRDGHVKVPAGANALHQLRKEVARRIVQMFQHVMGHHHVELTRSGRYVFPVHRDVVDANVLGVVQHFLTRVGLLVRGILVAAGGRPLASPPAARAGSGCNQGTGSGRGPDSKRPAIRLRRLAYSSLLEADRHIRAPCVTVMIARAA